MTDVIHVLESDRERIALHALKEALGHCPLARVRFLLTDGKGAAQGYRIYDVDLCATGIEDPGRVNVFLRAAGEDS